MKYWKLQFVKNLCKDSKENIIHIQESTKSFLFDIPVRENIVAAARAYNIDILIFN
jgi:hypothetical protein